MSANFYRLKNNVQEYPWGSKTMMAGLADNKDDKIQAELWIGAHPKSPSIIAETGTPLDEFIEKNPGLILGKDAGKFENKLPFLMKLIAVGSPLSVQVHPNKEQAAAGFARENAALLPIDSPQRNYRDPNHKPETICALSEFTLLCGFRKPGEIYDLFKMLLLRSLRDEIELLKKRDIRGFFQNLINSDKSRQKLIVSDFTASASSRIGLQSEAFPLCMELLSANKDDITALMPLMLNIIKLESGEALNIPSGRLHTYISGLGIELMANSDNVIRGGLTSKHVDIPELMNITVFEPSAMVPFRPETKQDGLAVYETSAEEFTLSEVKTADNIFNAKKEHGLEILFCTGGVSTIDFGGAKDEIKQGDSLLIPASSAGYSLSGNGRIFIASL
ncbi:MAG: mannose-6-phosphate isomerase, class I [Spirochaetia bacterium]|jgi:mannose-6-phosphate isomerase|nr:mannose-6-phosphate isomerase, class I [Spirochaetia bacterium]